MAKYPELFDAYVVISQAVNAPESERMMYRFALESAARQGNEKAAAHNGAAAEKVGTGGPPAR